MSVKGCSGTVTQVPFASVLGVTDFPKFGEGLPREYTKY